MLCMPFLFFIVLYTYYYGTKDNNNSNNDDSKNDNFHNSSPNKRRRNPPCQSWIAPPVLPLVLGAGMQRKASVKRVNLTGPVAELA